MAVGLALAMGEEEKKFGRIDGGGAMWLQVWSDRQEVERGRALEIWGDSSNC